MNSGWKCPTCGCVYGPWVYKCEHCPPTTTSSDVDFEIDWACTRCLGKTARLKDARELLRRVKNRTAPDRIGPGIYGDIKDFLEEDDE